MKSKLRFAEPFVHKLQQALGVHIGIQVLEGEWTVGLGDRRAGPELFGILHGLADGL